MIINEIVAKALSGSKAKVISGKCVEPINSYIG